MLRQETSECGQSGASGTESGTLGAWQAGWSRAYLGGDDRGSPPSLVCLPFPFLFCLQNKETQKLQGSASDHLTLQVSPSCWRPLYYGTIHVSSSSVFSVLLWAGGPLTECAKCHCCPVCLLEALDCSPSFPVFQTSPHSLGLMDSCSQSCQFQLSLWLRLQSDGTHKSLWQGRDPRRVKGQRVGTAQGCSGSQCTEPTESRSPGSAKRLYCVRGLCNGLAQPCGAWGGEK